MKSALLLLLLVSFPTTVLDSAFAADVVVRVATWNVEGVGAPTTAEYEAELAIIERIGADVVGINEVADDTDVANFESLASDASYPYTVVPASSPIGAMRSAFMSKFPILTNAILTAPDLSGDADANDISHLIVSIKIDLPDNDADLTLVVNHWKSGTGDADEFRRAVESIRVIQALAPMAPSEPFIILGDVNEEADSVPRSPNPFSSLPSGLPAGFSLGSDIMAQLTGPGIINDPFSYLSAAVPLDALQLDGDDATRPASGRRLDYIQVSHAIDPSAQGEVYDSADEGLEGGLLKFGSPLPPATSADASGELPVFADVVVPDLGTVPVLISSFEAAVVGGSVKLSWDVMLDDVALAGFRLRRGEATEPWVDINGPGLIPPDARVFVDDATLPGHTYHYRLIVVDASGSQMISSERSVRIAPLTAILEQNQPNPFHPFTSISFTVPQPVHAVLSVFDVSGRRVAALTDETMGAGRWTTTWNGRDAAGQPVASGVYYYRLDVGGRTLTCKMVLIR